MREIPIAGRRASPQSFLQRSLDRLDDVAEADLPGGPRQHVATPGAALAPHQFGPSQALEDLLQVAARDALPLADDPHLDGTRLAVVGEVEHPADGILGLLGKPHGASMQEPLPSRQPASSRGSRTGLFARSATR